MIMMVMMLYHFDTYDDADDELTSSHPEYSKHHIVQSRIMWNSFSEATFIGLKIFDWALPLERQDP